MAKIATNTNFDELLQEEKLVIVDFWATWCGPCRMLSPLLDEVGEEMADKVEVVKVNVDDADEIAMRYRIMSAVLSFSFRRDNDRCSPLCRRLGRRPRRKESSFRRDKRTPTAPPSGARTRIR